MPFDFQKYISIGVNHHLLCKFLAVDNASHCATLLPMLQDERFDQFDLWIVPEEPYRSIEMRAIRDCGKPIIYNVGDRAGNAEMFPTAKDSAIRKYTIDMFKSEIERGVECGTKKVVTSSGRKHPDVSREEAFDQLVDFYIQLCDFVPKDVEILIEPTDTDFDKCFFIGTSAESARVVDAVRAAGRPNMGSMIDMCHLPQFDETCTIAMRDLGARMRHVHLGTCVTEDKSNPFYGDKHPGWGLEGTCWGKKELAEMIQLGLDSGYFSKENRGTATFEMVAYDKENYLDSLNRFLKYMDETWQEYFKGVK